MCSNEGYTLDWDGHSSHLSKALNIFLKRQHYLDVTISCEGKKLRAHKLILSAFSEYFHDLFMDDPSPHTIVVLRGCDYESVNSILKFMYEGTTTVPMSRFSTFLKTAEYLKISGISNDKDEDDIVREKISYDINIPENDTITTRVNKPCPLSKKKKPHDSPDEKKRSFEDGSDDDSKHVKKIKESAISKSKGDSKVAGLKFTDDKSNYVHPEKSIDMKKLLTDKNVVSKEKNPFNACPVCSTKFPNMYLLKQHLPFHLGDTKCDFCKSVFSRVDLLKKHINAVHNSA